jgi:hypothetical protein
MAFEHQLSEARMSLRHAVSMFLSTVLIAGLCATASGQNGKGIGNRHSQSRLNQIPGMFQPQVRSLGKRAKEKGKERTIYTGQLFDKNGNSSPVQIIHQLPNLVRLEGFKSRNSVLSFDGEQGKGASSSKEEALIEVFSMDTPEGMLAQVQESAAVRFLGHGFGPDPKKNPKYSGPRYSLYDVTSPMRCRKDKVLRSRIYYFDSQTMLLDRTQYTDRSAKIPVKNETRFSMWGEIDGSAYPARIDHYEGGELVFTFIAESIENGEAADVAEF